jgi:hypothetical protein
VTRIGCDIYRTTWLNTLMSSSALSNCFESIDSSTELLNDSIISIVFLISLIYSSCLVIILAFSSGENFPSFACWYLSLYRSSCELRIKGSLRYLIDNYIYFIFYYYYICHKRHWTIHADRWFFDFLSLLSSIAWFISCFHPALSISVLRSWSFIFCMSEENSLLESRSSSRIWSMSCIFIRSLSTCVMVSI